MHVGMELTQEDDGAATLTQGDFANNSKLIPTSPDLRRARQKSLPADETELCQCRMGEVRRPATLPRQNTCARLARPASRVNDLQGSDVYRINDLVRTVKKWAAAPILKYASPSNPKGRKKGAVDGDMGARGGRVHCGTMSLVGWSGAVYGDQSAGGRCRVGHVSGLMSSTLDGPF